MLNRFQKMIEVIAKEDTGSRKQFAKRLGVSENTLWNYIQVFKEHDIVVKYDRRAKTYLFDIPEDMEVRVNWEFGTFKKAIKDS